MNAAGGSGIPAADSAQAKPAGVAEALTPGELLRRERERCAISIQQAAEDLHLDTRTVEAIEDNRFAALGVPVYARGHLRRYAALLGLSPEYIIQRYEALTDRPGAPTPVPASKATTTSVMLERRSRKGPFWLAAALVAVALGWWIYGLVTASREPVQPAVTVEPPVESAVIEPATTVTPPANSPMLEPATSVAPSPAAVASNATQPPAVVTNAPATTAQTAANDVHLRLEYSDPSWTEVYDGAGKRLLFGLGDTGRVRTVAGSPPLRVTLGYASAVTVQVNDRSVVVPRQSGKDSARFLIAANGAVQMMSGEVSGE